LNYGDCYATSPNGRSAADTKATGNDDRTFRDKPFSTIGPIYDPAGGAKGGGKRGANKGNGLSPDGRVVAGGHLKAKDLCMVPNRLAIALQEDGWWVRSEIIWAKPNPMPESIKDRPATAHEKIFMLSRAPRYFYDAQAVRQQAVGETEHDLTGGGYSPPGQTPQAGSRKARKYKVPDGWDIEPGSHGSRHKRGRDKGVADYAEHKAGNRDSFARVHKATAGDHGQKPQHRPDREDVDYPRGEGRSLRNYEPAPMQVWTVATAAFSEAHFATFPPELAERCIKAGCPAAGRVLDPFGGAGTVGLVADRHGLDCTLIELNPEYAEIARKRIQGDAGMFAAVEVAA
jgi:hypothetical protein